MALGECDSRGKLVALREDDVGIEVGINGVGEGRKNATSSDFDLVRRTESETEMTAVVPNSIRAENRKTREQRKLWLRGGVDVVSTSDFLERIFMRQQRRESTRDLRVHTSDFPLKSCWCAGG
eukprot:CAMPEP_0184651260 /NCGR_PEP_ID=MMETSP0308-20130426/8842_1 /TAXON_ID=38269 /ORGANISM="Gloeochaete witrockiana, Strain SAG 46.84" /LENGTH=122 /DNA_ID=CAMNT_0027085349 /DNA_START=1087 /DNA_END=1455 /DNA_ORIENTATION=-